MNYETIIIGVLLLIVIFLNFKSLLKISKKKEQDWRLDAILRNHIELMQLQAISLLCELFKSMNFGEKKNVKNWFFEKRPITPKTKAKVEQPECIRASYRIYKGAEIEFKFDFYPQDKIFAQRLGRWSNLYELIRDIC